MRDHAPTPERPARTDAPEHPPRQEGERPLRARDVLDPVAPRGADQKDDAPADDERVDRRGDVPGR